MEEPNISQAEIASGLLKSGDEAASKGEHEIAQGRYDSAVFLFRRMGNFELAVECLEKSLWECTLADVPDYRKIYDEFHGRCKKAELYLMMEKLEDAVRELTKALALTRNGKLRDAWMKVSRDIESSFRRAVFSGRQEELYATAVFHALVQLFLCKYNLGTLDEQASRSLLKRIVEHYTYASNLAYPGPNPSFHPSIRTKLALCYTLAGERQVALRYLAEASEMIQQQGVLNEVYELWYVTNVFALNKAEDKKIAESKIEYLKTATEKDLPYIADAILLQKLISKMSERRCTNCGAFMPIEAKYCGIFGQKIRTD